MPRLATKLAPTNRGGFIARKVIPFDVRDEYAKLYGQRNEERLNTGPLPVSLARAKHREWSSEIEARIANIRAARKGEGRTLTPKEARALAGEWYLPLAEKLLVVPQQLIRTRSSSSCFEVLFNGTANATRR